ncbi:MAG TPA: M28 family peptidase [Gemmatimonadaceae bacterium]|nr:M28 family peptidase [Gemmatimonadaceae bacterium]
MSAERARRHLQAIAAAPRPAGSDAERRAREHCAAVLRESGYVVREEPFTYSTLPGKWGTPAAGVLSALVLAGASLAGAHGHARAALGTVAAGAVLLAALGHWLAHHAVLAIPVARAHGVNLVATRSVPSVWLVAHLDSKSQPVPIAVRAFGVMASIAVWLLAIALAASGSAGWIGAPALWPWIGVAGAVAALPVIASVVSARSPGALDDASGVATVLLAAAEVDDERVGVLLTSAEELGLAGARAWVRARASRGGCGVNVDGVDDTGHVRVTVPLSRGARVARALAHAAEQEGVHVDVRPLVPGVLLDAVALSDAGWEVATVSRGRLATVLRIHTPRDVVGTMSGQGIAETARVVAGAVTLMLREG